MIDIRKYIFKMGIELKLFGGFAVLILVSYILYTFSIIPLINRQKHLKVNLSIQEQLVTSRKADIVNIDSLEEELRMRKEDLKKVEAMFLKEEQLPTLFMEIRKLAEDMDVNIVNLKVLTKKPLKITGEKGSAEYEELPVDLTLNGDYLNVMTFFTKLREKDILFSIPSLSISRGRGEAGIINLGSRVIFYLVLQEK